MAAAVESTRPLYPVEHHCEARGPNCIDPRGVVYDDRLKRWLCHLCWVSTPIVKWERG